VPHLHPQVIVLVQDDLLLRVLGGLIPAAGVIKLVSGTFTYRPNHHWRQYNIQPYLSTKKEHFENERILRYV
jgi:hypothetical protein